MDGAMFGRIYRRRAFHLAAVLLLSSALLLGLAAATGTWVPARAQTGVTLTVPYHSQPMAYYCFPACLEMVFDYYGPDVSQDEIASVAQTWLSGTYPQDGRRAAHYSILSGGGYTDRFLGLGYGAFEHSAGTPWREALKLLITAGYPIIVVVNPNGGPEFGHALVVVGYTDTNVIVHDPNFAVGAYDSRPWADFEADWAWSGYWGLYTSPWRVVVTTGPIVGGRFTVAASVNYPCPQPFVGSDYPASSSQANITLQSPLALAPGEPAGKTLGSGTMNGGDWASVSWQVLAPTTPGSYGVRVTGYGDVAGSSNNYPSYSDRIGGTSTGSSTVPGGGCFIATAAYGSRLAPQVETMREFRDDYLLGNWLGERLVSLYYRVSPPVAGFIDEHPALKSVARVCLLPAVAISAAATGTGPAEKIAIASSLAAACVMLSLWVKRRHDRPRSPA